MNCVHHWIIESTREATAAAVCQKCGATTHFDNGWMIGPTQRELNAQAFAPRETFPDYHALGFAQHDSPRRRVTYS